ncbi:hypothetical protein ARMGADRAFT_1063017 [Armillaria gallica]|uniref:Uncharacterized protein n=1 Tax=Armillaria gallica TaxID=47427 RepID=A0A2H3DIH5_ARMGA|nr:hypothetical protein ARMGADRAFT_1063017 [Armillaria gallica]
MSDMDLIVRLDDDILLEIFLHICSEKPENEYPKSLYSALQLSLVCSRWRGVALSFPRLWTNITVLFSVEASRDGEPGPAECAYHAMIQEEITNLYIQRSQGWLISIFVCKSTKSPRSTATPSIRMFPISDRQIDLLCQATGWKEISFLSTDYSQHGEARSWRRLLEKGASCCKTLDTVVLSENSTKLHNSPAFSLASNLHNLYVHGSNCCRGLVYESSQSDFPFNKIRLLAINSFPTGGKIEDDSDLPVTHDALSCFPYLRDLIVTVPHANSSRILIPSMLPFPYLTSLNLLVDYTNQGKVKSFLFNISSPCLRSFALRYRDDIVQHPLAEESVISFLRTCSRSLRSFTLEKVPIRPSTLINILSVVPGLTHLELRDLVPGSFIPYCPVSQVLATYMETNPMFLADLEAVVLIWQREDTEGKLEKALVEMVETRSVYGKLKEVTIGRLNPYEELSVDTNHRLAALKRGSPTGGAETRPHNWPPLQAPL